MSRGALTHAGDYVRLATTGHGRRNALRLITAATATAAAGALCAGAATHARSWLRTSGSTFLGVGSDGCRGSVQRFAPSLLGRSAQCRHLYGRAPRASVIRDAVVEDSVDAPPIPTGEAAELLTELSRADDDTDPADYWVDGAWDLPGLRSDVDLVRERSPSSEGQGSSQVGSAGAHAEQDVAPFDGVLASEWLLGTVHGAAPFGSLLVDVGAPSNGAVVRGLVRAAALPHGEPAGSFHLGRAVHVRVVSVDTAAGALSLSMRGEPDVIKADLEAQLRTLRQMYGDLGSEIDTATTIGPTNAGSAMALADSQDVSAFRSVSPAQWLTGTVHHAASFGVYVSVAPPGGGPSAWGLAHLPQMDRSLSELQPGQGVQVRVLGVDVAKGRLTLSMK